MCQMTYLISTLEHIRTTLNFKFKKIKIAYKFSTQLKLTMQFYKINH